MNDEHKALADRIAAVETRVAEIASYLRSALQYLSTDPQSSLTKSRVVLEKVLLSLYRTAMKKEPPRPMIGDMLSDKNFTASIPKRIVARMNAVRDMSNLGPHGGEVEAIDAVRVMRDLVDVLEWYVANYDPICLVPEDRQTRQALEILPHLKSKYPRYLRPEIISVRFIQSDDRCHLEVTTVDHVGESLLDETSKRTDLAFIAGGAGADDRFFSPMRPITENAHRFVAEFDEISIINCTDLFSEDAAMRIDEFWREHGRTPDRE
jgi:Domain of unknown function (DUF4145)